MHDSQFAINNFLRSKGLAGLSEAGPLISQLAYFVRNDRHFGALLNACEPERRGDMYNALAPNLRFKARPLADYMIEHAQDAEARQLPTITEDGQFKPFRMPEVETGPIEPEDAIATAAAAIAEERLEVVCPLCTRAQIVDGITKDDVVRKLRALGWRRGFKGQGTSEVREVEVCPRCVKQRAPRIQAA